MFDGIKIDGGAFFRPDQHGKGNRVEFKGLASFRSAIFSTDAQFTGAEFNGAADFGNAEFCGTAYFTSAQFAKEAIFKGVRFAGAASFEKTQFKGPTEFSETAAQRDALFDCAVFSDKVSFCEAKFHVVLFREDTLEKAPDGSLLQFAQPVDLRGFTYERIRVAWRDLLDKLTPYDRQPYTQLETAIRATGEDRMANDVYHRRRIREMHLRWKAGWHQVRRSPFIQIGRAHV